ncbi:MAG TPA: hypothetical protein PLY87_19505 [Planctomycetaceae bacterium]|nr:hypothetical protein [Planctomycetaceae bacterium]HQZ67290.1 hypothetical protein [Planctomycetaceae bacterium]
MTQTTLNTQATIFSRALGASSPPLTEDLARYLLSIQLDPSDEQRANALADKARQGSLSTQEQAEIDEYRRVGRLIETLKLRAHQKLHPAG